MSTQYEIANEGVYSENFGDESVVVNMKAGNYYSLTGMASYIWDSLSAHVSVEALENAIAKRYHAPTAKADVRHFIKELVNEKLIHPTLNHSNADSDFSLAPAAYSVPLLRVFKDLQEYVIGSVS